MAITIKINKDKTWSHTVIFDMNKTDINKEQLKCIDEFIEIAVLTTKALNEKEKEKEKEKNEV
jgi:hypothetical protein